MFIWFGEEEAAEASKSKKTERKNSILRAWLGDSKFKDRFMAETYKIKMWAISLVDAFETKHSQLLGRIRN